MAESDPYKAATERLFARKEAEKEKALDKLKAMERGIKNLYRDLLQDEEVKSSVSQEMISGVKGESRVSQVLEKLMGRQKTADGINAGDIESFHNETNCPTGQDEDRYWERD